MPPHPAALTRDLELETLFTAMAGGDQFLYEVARRAVLSSLKAPDTILYHSIQILELFVGTLRRLRTSLTARPRASGPRRAPELSWKERLGLGPRSGSGFTIPDRDENGFKALEELRARGINEVANAPAQSTDHILSFFAMLRTELGRPGAHRQRLDLIAASRPQSWAATGRANISRKG